MKILGVIPARGGSKGILNKNIKILKNKPLIAYTIEAALQSKLNKVLVSTDSKKIAKVSESYGVEVIKRPFELAKSSTPTLPVIQHALLKIKESFDAVMTLQPTSPLRKVNHIDEAIKLFNANKEADSLVSVVEVPHNFSNEKIMSYDGKFLLGDSRPKKRQDVQKTYARNGAAIYITKIDKIDQYIFGGKILPYFMKKIHSFDIDDEDDWEIVEQILTK